ncbi:hypothetical protein AB4037_05195 [Labrys sp. KB_33_2]|uniref:hypothetical protein n=1 Tax=unclassified Labrys (in: a-proteobacteria) TaxID=2688601 RepID=UPI003EC0F01B
MPKYIVPKRQISPFGLRMDPELRKLLEGQSKLKGLSLNSLIVSILETHVHGTINLVDRVAKLEEQFQEVLTK